MPLRYKMVIDRFFEKVKITSHCWIWNASKNEDGYGLFRFNGKVRRAHQFSYKLYKGKLKDGCEIDHICKNRSCVNPYHMEGVTHKENTLRGNTVGGVYARRTHCKSGHPFTGENVYSRGPGLGRGCRACNKIWNMNKKARKEAKNAM